MVEENISQEFWLKNMEIIKNHFIKYINQNELMNSNMHKKVCAISNYTEYLN